MCKNQAFACIPVATGMYIPCIAIRYVHEPRSGEENFLRYQRTATKVSMII